MRRWVQSTLQRNWSLAAGCVKRGVSILSVRLRQSVPNFSYEEINSHHLPDAYRASWKRWSELGGGYPKP